MIVRYNRLSFVWWIPGFGLAIAGRLAGNLIVMGLGIAMMIIGFAYYARAKGRSAAWCLLGLFGLLGWIVLALLKDESEEEEVEGGAGAWVFALLVLAGAGTYFYFARGPTLVSDNQADFSVRVPAGWKRTAREQFAWQFEKGRGYQGAAINILFIPNPDTPARPGLDDLGSLLTGLRDDGLCRNIEDKERIEVSGLEAFRFTCSGMPVEGTSLVTKGQAVLIFRERRGVYFLGIDSAAPKLPGYLPEFRQIVASFHAPAE